MKLYLDLCCLKRPFDDQSDARVQMETTAVAAVLVPCLRGEQVMMTSDALRFENHRNPNPERQEFAARALAQAGIDVAHDPALEQRAAVWQNEGVGLLDALHLASAERGGADVFATTDDVFLRRAFRVGTSLRVVSLLELVREIAP
jgi:predicted nucleic acid-binding protein